MGTVSGCPGHQDCVSKSCSRLLNPPAGAGGVWAFSRAQRCPCLCTQRSCPGLLQGCSCAQSPTPQGFPLHPLTHPNPSKPSPHPIAPHPATPLPLLSETGGGTPGAPISCLHRGPVCSVRGPSGLPLLQPENCADFLYPTVHYFGN